MQNLSLLKNMDSSYCRNIFLKLVVARALHVLWIKSMWWRTARNVMAIPMCNWRNVKMMWSLFWLAMPDILCGRPLSKLKIRHTITCTSLKSNQEKTIPNLRFRVVPSQTPSTFDKRAVQHHKRSIQKTCSWSQWYLVILVFQSCKFSTTE